MRWKNSLPAKDELQVSCRVNHGVKGKAKGGGEQGEGEEVPEPNHAPEPEDPGTTHMQMFVLFLSFLPT